MMMRKSVFRVGKEIVKLDTVYMRKCISAVLLQSGGDLLCTACQL